MSLSLDATTAPADPPNSKATKVIKVLSLFSANCCYSEKNASAMGGGGGGGAGEAAMEEMGMLLIAFAGRKTSARP